MANTEVVAGTITLTHSKLVFSGLSKTIHPNYKPNVTDHTDLALVHVKGGGLISSQHKTSSAQIDSEKNRKLVGVDLVVSGYGTAFQKFPIPNLYLKTTTIQGQSPDVCSKIYDPKDFDPKSGYDLCAGDMSGKTGLRRSGFR